MQHPSRYRIGLNDKYCVKYKPVTKHLMVGLCICTQADVVGNLTVGVCLQAESGDISSLL